MNVCIVYSILIYSRAKKKQRTEFLLKFEINVFKMQEFSIYFFCFCSFWLDCFINFTEFYMFVYFVCFYYFFLSTEIKSMPFSTNKWYLMCSMRRIPYKFCPIFCHEIIFYFFCVVVVVINSFICHRTFFTIDFSIQ